MGEIAVSAPETPTTPYSRVRSPCQRAYVELAASQRGRPIAEIVPLRRAGRRPRAFCFTGADLTEQAEAIRSGRPVRAEGPRHRVELASACHQLRCSTLGSSSVGASELPLRQLPCLAWARPR